VPDFTKCFLELPYSALTGLGATGWQTAVWVSSGLALYLYNASQETAVIPVGLDTLDGLPAEYAGIISDLIPERRKLYVLVDSSLDAATTSTSILASFDGKEWRTEWIGDSTEKAMHGGIVSSAYAYRLWFSHGDEVYYLPLQDNALNPKKVSTWTYDTSGVFISSISDCNWAAGNKVATEVEIEIRDASATETVTVQYRINHSNTDLTTGWTTLDAALDSDGRHTLSFGSNGVEFRDIQFRLSLARGGTNTTSPIVVSMVLKFKKNTTAKWAYSAMVDVSKPYPEVNPLSPTQQVAKLVTASATGTLVEFAFEGDEGGVSKYGIVTECSGLATTGEGKQGLYNVTVSEI